MHHIDRCTPWDEIWEAFEREVRSCKVDYIGSSNFTGWHLAKAQAAAQAGHFMGIACEQHKYSMLNRWPEMEVIPAARDLGIGLVCWGPLDGGLLGVIGGIRTRAGRRGSKTGLKPFVRNWTVRQIVRGTREVGGQRGAMLDFDQSGVQGGHHRPAHRGAA